jgi:hypothetical protein
MIGFLQSGYTPEILILKQLYKVLYMWFIAMCSEEKPVTGTTIIGKSCVFL